MVDEDSQVILLSLDLSTAFDTVDVIVIFVGKLTSLEHLESKERLTPGSDLI